MSTSITLPPASPAASETASVTLEIRVAPDRVTRLSHLAEAQHLSPDQLIEKALDLLFTMAEIFDDAAERRAWQRLSEAALYRFWNNEQDAVYDNWRELYGVPER